MKAPVSSIRGRTDGMQARMAAVTQKGAGDSSSRNRVIDKRCSSMEKPGFRRVFLVMMQIFRMLLEKQGRTFV